jgi:hypothetical protein
LLRHHLHLLTARSLCCPPSPADGSISLPWSAVTTSTCEYDHEKAVALAAAIHAHERRRTQRRVSLLLLSRLEPGPLGERQRIVAISRSLGARRLLRGVGGALLVSTPKSRLGRPPVPPVPSSGSSGTSGDPCSPPPHNAPPLLRARPGAQRALSALSQLVKKTSSSGPQAMSAAAARRASATAALHCGGMQAQTASDAAAAQRTQAQTASDAATAQRMQAQDAALAGCGAAACTPTPVLARCYGFRIAMRMMRLVPGV